MANLGGGHQTRTRGNPWGRLRVPVQIARGNLHNLIGDPDACPKLHTTMIELRDTTKLLGRQSIHEEQSLGYQAPKGNKLLKLFHFHITVENSNRRN